MPNIDDLQTFLKADICEEGDTIKFVDAGRIYVKDWKKQDGTVEKRTTLEITVVLNGEKRLTYSPNATSIKLLSEAYGKDTEKWVHRKAEVMKVDQLSFGKMIKILVIKPFGVTANVNRDPQDHEDKPKSVNDVVFENN